eukprot:2221558-Pleurochrysis_carterae.AAC.1
MYRIRQNENEVHVSGALKGTSQMVLSAGKECRIEARKPLCTSVYALPTVTNCRRGHLRVSMRMWRNVGMCMQIFVAQVGARTCTRVRKCVTTCADVREYVQTFVTTCADGCGMCQHA